MPVPAIADTSPSNGVAYLAMVASLTRNTKVFNFLGLPAMSVCIVVTAVFCLACIAVSVGLANRRTSHDTR